ncbi:PP2C family serine/threonine-protein phosphatase [Microbacterium sp. SD291]|uniref:PP2C family protein-serine/threonine phosphatase n=1 Tax=Microbacterium sp. SD291 TaxID=2782007 RepID=UPI001A9791DE|nr:protein phosphatase 2C domain-containing protein [Microbacterium sp. SD291]MBO0980608.1 serine/threonine-protein phosphatase [Microbacterium sp. SD291]
MAETTTKTHDVTVAQRQLVLSWAGVTDVGRRREANQDAFFAEYPLFIVADGMGGHAGGEIASRSTVHHLSALVAEEKVQREAIEAALEAAVRDIADHPEATDEGTGTTLTGVFLEFDENGPHWVTLNIGDSRVYLLRDERLVQVTTDHSVVQELIAAGKISPEEAEGHPYSNVITRAVGASELTAPDYVTLDIRAGDRFVICSDGLTKELTDYGIQHFLREHAEPAAAVDAMLVAALENGGRDNVTVVVVQVEDDSSSTSGPPAE